MKRSDFRIKEYRGKFYIERATEQTTWIHDKGFKIGNWFQLTYKEKPVKSIVWLRVDDYGNPVATPKTLRDFRAFVDRRLPYFKTLAKAKKKVEEFFQEPKYHYLK